MSSQRSRSALGKPTAIDYVVMIGGPLAFFAIAFWGIVWLLGPAPPANPITLLKRGEVKVGMTQAQVVEKVGEPQSLEPQPDGGVGFVYHRGTAEPYVEEEAEVLFNSSGFVVRVSIQKAAAPVQGTENP